MLSREGCPSLVVGGWIGQTNRPVKYMADKPAVSPRRSRSNKSAHLRANQHSLETGAVYFLRCTELCKAQFSVTLPLFQKGVSGHV